MNKYIITPANKRIGANAVKSKAVICAVIVVPMLAPMITAMASANSIKPEFTKPITIISVADDD